MECLSAKTLSGRSFRNSANRITMSAPLVYSTTHSNKVHTKPYVATPDDCVPFPLQGSTLFSCLCVFVFCSMY